VHDADPNLDELLMRAARGLRRRWAHALEPLLLTPHHARALRVVGELGSPRLGVVAERLHIAPRSATEVIDALAERGLVERISDAVDRRAIQVVLTTKGTGVLADVNATQSAAGAAHFSTLSEEDRTELARLLAKVDVKPGDAGHGRGAPNSPS
jgi:DNA-binding MarR family transcriptional regulator